MTVDDISSIYVGGLPYDITEDGLRNIFFHFGAIIAVKIINDRTVGGKCYGFVTFANPRSAVQAIREMDGKTIHGRVVKVNDVRTRGGKPHFNRDPRHDMDRSVDGDRGRNRGRDDSYDRHRHQEGHRDRSQDHEENRERGHDRTRGHDHDRVRDRYVDEDRLRDYGRHVDDVEQEHGRKRDHDRERNWERDDEKNIEQQRNTIHHRSEDKEKEQRHHYMKRSRFDDRGSRERSLDSFNDDLDQRENQLADSNMKLEELRKEMSQMEELVRDKQEIISTLEERYQKVEDSVIAAKKLTSRRHMQISKLRNCYMQMRDYHERFKNSEQELQWLVDATAIELDNEGGVVGDGIVTNGRA